VLLYDTDIDLIYSTAGNGSYSLGVDFSRNISSDLAIHGEYAQYNSFTRQLVDREGNTSQQKFNARSYLLGLRHKTRQDTTFILEYYRNGKEYSSNEMRGYYSYSNKAYNIWQTSGNRASIKRALNLNRSSYGQMNPMEDYFYLRVSKKDPFNIVYFTPALTGICGINDRSFTISPELNYNPATNLKFRFKLVFNIGPRFSEFGERPADFRTEIRARYYF